MENNGILTMAEFEKLPFASQKERLEKWIEVHGAKTIQNIWGVSKGKYYNILRKVGVEVAPTKGNGKNKTNRRVSSKNSKPKTTAVKVGGTDVIIISLAGKLTGTSLRDRLSKLMKLVDDDNMAFEVGIQIKESVL